MASLANLAKGKKAKISGFSTHTKAWQRFMEMGLKINETIQILEKLPFGGNLIVLSNYGKYSLRGSSARHIQVDELD